MTTDFYSVSEWRQQSDSLSCRLAFDAGHRIFQGHFPGNPIVPGVCSLAILKSLLERATQHHLILRESSMIKFLGLIRPESRPTVHMNWHQENGLIAATASLLGADAPLLKLSAKYAAIPG